MKISEKTADRAVKIALILFAAFCWWQLVRFARDVYPVSPWFNSDSATELLYARYMAQTGKLLPGTWYFTTEVRLLHNSLVMAPLLAFIADFATVHVLAVAIVSALLYGAGLLFCRCMGLGWTPALLGGLLLVIPFSVDTFDYYQNSMYYSFFLLSLVLLWSGIAWSMAPGRGTAQRLWCLAACGVLSFVMGVCGIRYLEVLFFPLGLAAGLRVLRRGMLRRESWNGQWHYFILSVAGLAGYLIVHFAQELGMFPSGALSQIAVAAPATWPARLLETLHAYWAALRVVGPSDELFWLLLFFSWGFLWRIRKNLPVHQADYLVFAALTNLINIVVLVLVDFGSSVQYRYTLLPCTLAWMAIPIAAHCLRDMVPQTPRGVPLGISATLVQSY